MQQYQRHKLSVAPMLDWTDRHCRYFHRLLSSETLLYTEMVVAEAILHGDRQKLLGFDPAEQPVALQIGGSDPVKVGEAARIGAEMGYGEINLNVGCPSDRVQSGTFGACLMREPQRVADCVAAMKATVSIPVTVKCRIGVDDQDPEEALDTLADLLVAAGVDALWVHARKAWLQGLSPKENRDIPPLDYDRVYRLKARLPDLFIGINGGIKSLDEAEAHLAHVDGVMIGRAAYQEPELLAAADRRIYGKDRPDAEPREIIEAMLPYIEAQLAAGTPLNHMARHMLGLYHGRPGARRFRQILTIEGAGRSAGIDVFHRAMDAVDEITATVAASAADSAAYAAANETAAAV
ncbi:tRNA dihydrouridine(20/20a) synthase DusA [Kaistia defluvii]|uniref:tRNA dihydrouridine(20/20a) synthase DusA n=1 Tax=Kaistia defluvii TaxID=410841 RepID=UPI002250E832|nr:tRNA dihydrouridine(20/20a) synthase DusA [Kaistia defluvii]MCX5520343.1 tRNA dihydrouridine(20/20a) synthase DusA [Kaistia defluvii]